MAEKMRKVAFKSAAFGLTQYSPSSCKWLAQLRSYVTLEAGPAGASLALGQAGIPGP